MKRAVLIVAAAALCVAGSAVAQDRGGLIGSGTRSDSGQVVGSGNAAGQTVGSGGFTTPADSGSTALTSDTRSSGQVMGSGGRAADSGQIFGSGGRAEDTSPIFGSGGRATSNGILGGYLGSGLAVSTVPLFDGFSLLVVSSDGGAFVIPIGD